MSAHRIRVYDVDPPLIPYVSQTDAPDEWRDVATVKWSELGLPESPPPNPSWEPCYVRWGDYPQDGRSFNHQLQEAEPGVAVFRAYYTQEGDYVLDLESSVTLAILFVRLSTSGRRVYRVYGAPCGTGGGGVHAYIAYEQMEPPVPSGTALVPGVDVLAGSIERRPRGAWVVLPPSVGKTGRYAWG